MSIRFGAKVGYVAVGTEMDKGYKCVSVLVCLCVSVCVCVWADNADDSEMCWGLAD